MQKLFRNFLIGLTFVALNVGTVEAQTGMTQPPVTDGMPSCAAPVQTLQITGYVTVQLDRRQ